MSVLLLLAGAPMSPVSASHEPGDDEDQEAASDGDAEDESEDGRAEQEAEEEQGDQGSRSCITLSPPAVGIDPDCRPVGGLPPAWLNMLVLVGFPAEYVTMHPALDPVPLGQALFATSLPAEA